MAAKRLQQNAFQSVASESTRVSLRTGNNVLQIETAAKLDRCLRLQNTTKGFLALTCASF